MGKNNSKARREWRKKRAEKYLPEQRAITPEERLLRAIFGTANPCAMYNRPGCEDYR